VQEGDFEFTASLSFAASARVQIFEIGRGRFSLFKIKVSFAE